MNLPKIFILSLPDAIQRRRSATLQCAQYHLPFEYVEALDFRHIPNKDAMHHYEPTRQAQQKNKLLSPAEIACAWGHQKIYRTIGEQKIQFSLVLEDDFKWIENPYELFNHVDLIQNNTDFDILILGYVKMLTKDLPYHYRRLPIKKLYAYSHYQFGIPWQQFGCGTIAYIITLRGAQKLQTNIIKVAADDWLHFAQQCKVNVIHVRPLIVLENCENFDSSIREETANYLHIKTSSYIIRSIKGSVKNSIMNGLIWKK